MQELKYDDLLASVSDFFRNVGYEVRSEALSCPESSGRVDLVVSKPGSPKFVIELKSGVADDFLPYSAYSEAQRLSMVSSESNPAQAVLLTNMNVSDDLRSLFKEAQLPLVEIKGGMDQNALSEDFQKAFKKVGKNITFELGAQVAKRPFFLSSLFSKV